MKYFFSSLIVNFLSSYVTFGNYIENTFGNLLYKRNKFWKMPCTGIHDTGIHDTGIHDTGIHDTGIQEYILEKLA